MNVFKIAKHELLTNAFDFDGKTTRKNYWFSQLVLAFFTFVFIIIGIALFLSELLVPALLLTFTLPLWFFVTYALSFSMTLRRFKDAGVKPIVYVVIFIASLTLFYYSSIVSWIALIVCLSPTNFWINKIPYISEEEK